MRTNSVDRVYSITIRVDSNASTRSTVCVVAIVAVQAIHIIYLLCGPKLLFFTAV